MKNYSIPFLSSIVTVSLAHFMRNLGEDQRCALGRALGLQAQLDFAAGKDEWDAYLTSFILAFAVSLATELGVVMWMSGA